MNSLSQSAPINMADDGNSRARDDAEIIDAGLAAVKEWEAEHGTFTKEEIAWANDVLDRGHRFYETPWPSGEQEGTKGLRAPVEDSCGIGPTHSRCVCARSSPRSRQSRL